MGMKVKGKGTRNLSMSVLLCTMKGTGSARGAEKFDIDASWRLIR